MIEFSQCFRLRGMTAFERILSIADSKESLLKEFNNYMQAGVVVSTPIMFLMAKPVDSSNPPDDQWWVENPDAWYIRWASGRDALLKMMSIGQPLPSVIFRRVKNGETKSFKKYEWNKLRNRIEKLV